MKLLTMLAISSLTALSFNAAAAGDQKVNCKTTTQNIPYYYGWASCWASGRFMQEHVSRSATQWYTISETVYENGQWNTYQCSDTLTSVAYDTVTQESCEYTPLAVIREHLITERYDSRTGTTYYKTGVVVADFNYSDRDGQVQKVEKWVGGVSTAKSHVDITSPTTVRLRVTDNDGNVTDTSRTVSPPMIQQCSRGGMMIICDMDF
ncbi:hypothetical protein HG263_04455 [Pseudoalteromonas sp. JBTF-M23]|uniref:Uncharacterized protein n=1 Tax=Pseudoalteromonas caenipelagi TaxID=2726988 RepID=A0A849VA34_9GAMM|nr:hypothetical protein [Pseudoalteromonas caenipelagi]NOU49785.1 hypothetical protein [Pseudoalteromonas caenipelagi]